MAHPTLTKKIVTIKHTLTKKELDSFDKRSACEKVTVGVVFYQKKVDKK